MNQNITDIPNWVCWTKMARDNGKVGKMPINPKTGRGAKTNDASTLGTYAEACAAKQAKGYDGIGFEFTNSGLVGIDLDDCIEEDGALSPLSSHLVESISSYTELSPSGKGLHILVASALPEDFRKKNDALGLEAYQRDRFFTITGNIYDKKDVIKSIAPAELKDILAPYLGKASKETSSATTKATTPTTCDIHPQSFLSASDEEVLQKAFASKKGASIRSLYDGDISDFDDNNSQADLALCSHLAYWTGNDAEQMDRLFRSSGLMRDKWDEKRGTKTYGELTIEKALSPSTVESKTVSESPQPSSAPQKHDARLSFSTPGAYIASGAYDAKVRDFQKYKDRKTGFKNIDDHQSFYPGLYTVGAISSLGKTTFITQMADQLSAAGTNVLIFSYEQSTFELVAKGIARENAKLLKSKKGDLKKAPSSSSLRGGKTSDELTTARANYCQVTSHEYIIDCAFSTTIDTVIRKIHDFMVEHPADLPPVVVIDYLQVIGASEATSTRDHMDSIVQKLRQLCKEQDVTVLLISSFNRANYAAPVSFESFKESGGIEYTSDVTWGLQLACIDEDDTFEKDKDVNKKRKIINDAKGAIPRRIELVVLKDRNGRPNQKYFFNYYPNCDYFEPAKAKVTVCA